MEADQDPITPTEPLLRHLVTISQLAGHVCQILGVDSDLFLQTIYPAGLQHEHLLAESRGNPDLIRPDTLIRQQHNGSLHAIPYPLICPETSLELIHAIDSTRALRPPLLLDNYLVSIRRYFSTGSWTDYLSMNRCWMQTIDMPVTMPIVCDETYCDTRFGLKGTLDSAVFEVDLDLTQLVLLPQKTWSVFLNRLPETPGAVVIRGISARVYRTLSLDGALPKMKLRAWNLPNPHDLRNEVGTHQIIIRENTLRAFHEDLRPAIREIFSGRLSNCSDQSLLNGLLWTLSAHELGHNYGCYDAARSLAEFHDTFEEMKANILPLLWACFCLESGVISLNDCTSAIAVYLTLDLQDCILARELISRRCYCLATALQMNFMLDKGAVRIDSEGIRIDISAIWESNLTLLEICLKIMSEGDHDAAESLIRRYGHLSALSQTLDRMTDSSHVTQS